MDPQALTLSSFGLDGFSFFSLPFCGFPLSPLATRGEGRGWLRGPALSRFPWPFPSLCGPEDFRTTHGDGLLTNTQTHACSIRTYSATERGPLAILFEFG